jgi:flagellar protein FlbT
MPLQMKVRAGETVIIEGAPIRFFSTTTVLFMRDTDFMPARRILTADEADSWARRLYFAVQEVYTRPRMERAGKLGELECFLNLIEQAIRIGDVTAITLDEVSETRARAREGSYYAALRDISRVIDREDPDFWTSKKERTRTAEVEALTEARSAQEQRSDLARVRHRTREEDIARSALDI